GAGAQGPGADAGSGIGGEMTAVGHRRAGPRIDLGNRLRIACRPTDLPIVADHSVNTGDETAERAACVRGIAVAVELAPGAKALCPECQVAPAGRRRGHVINWELGCLGA